MSSAELAVAREGVEHAADVLDRVVRVRGEAEVSGARGGDDAVAVERLDERGRIGGGDAEERAAALGLPRGRDAGAERVEAVEQARVEAEHVLARLGDPDLLHQLHPGDAGVDGGDRRRPGLEAARRRRGRVVAVVHGEDVAVGEPAGRGRPDALHELAARVEEREAGRAEQVLEHAGGEEVDVELPYVEGQRADRLVGVEEDEGAALVPSPASGTWTTREPRASWACQIWPMVGNSQSVSTILERRA